MPASLPGLNAPAQDFWRQEPKQLLQALEGSPQGLSTTEAVKRLARFGPNRMVERPKQKLLTRFIKRMAEPLVAILLIAAAISGSAGDITSFVIILAIVSLSILLDILQEHHAERAAEALRRTVAIHADVRRDGALVSLPVDQVVPGDILELKAGDLVPADGIVLESLGAQANEALVTGEPYPVSKRAAACDAASPADAFNAVFAGTSIVNGEAQMLAVATGARTRFGGISAALGESEEPSALQRGTHQLGLLILRLTVFLVLFVLLLHLLLARPALDSFLFAVALAVGLTPELLPMVVTVTLSRGAVRLARKQVIVKRLSAIHDLGAMDVLCSDKTGTLTESRISLVSSPGSDGQDSARVLQLAGINSRFTTGIRSPFDDAILARCPEDRLGLWKKCGEVPFDFNRRRIAVAAQAGGKKVLVVKGAPESVMPLCSRIEMARGSTVPFTAARRAKIAQIHDERANRGLRLLAVAWKPLQKAPGAISAGDERDLIFAGFCIFEDPPKAGAAQAIQRLEKLKIRVKVLSGDNAAVVGQLAKDLAIPSGGILTGEQVDLLDEPSLAVRVEHIDLYARVSPDQKTRIIKALQARGHVVGFIGDGVNDAPAIHAAEVGFSVEGATDVARMAADMIMLERNLGVVADGVIEGRRTLANILKYVRMGTSSNFGNMLSMALASVALPFLPLLAPQILLNNLLYDLSEIGIPFDAVDADEVSVPHSWDIGKILRYTITMGLLSTVFDMITFFVLLRVFSTGPEAFRTAWFVESMATQILVIFVIRTWRHAWQSWANRILVASSLLALIAALAIALSPLGGAFGFVPIPGHLLLAIVAIVLSYLALAEAVKAISHSWLR